MFVSFGLVVEHPYLFLMGPEGRAGKPQTHAFGADERNHMHSLPDLMQANILGSQNM